MALVRRILKYLRPDQPARKARYSAEVLYAGWVDRPALLPDSTRR